MSYVVTVPIGRWSQLNYSHLSHSHKDIGHENHQKKCLEPLVPDPYVPPYSPFCIFDIACFGPGYIPEKYKVSNMSI